MHDKATCQRLSECGSHFPHLRLPRPPLPAPHIIGHSRARLVNACRALKEPPTLNIDSHAHLVPPSLLAAIRGEARRFPLELKV